MDNWLKCWLDKDSKCRNTKVTQAQRPKVWPIEELPREEQQHLVWSRLLQLSLLNGVISFQLSLNKWIWASFWRSISTIVARKCSWRTRALNAVRVMRLHKCKAFKQPLTIWSSCDNRKSRTLCQFTCLAAPPLLPLSRLNQTNS